MSDQIKPGLDDLVLDRLVDGELSEAEYRELIQLLDARPEGWRRCALSFLEAQAWRRELGGVGNDGAVPVPPVRLARGRMPWTFGGLIALASAASFLLAFFLAGRVLHTPQDSIDMPVASNVSKLPRDSVSPDMGGRQVGPWGEYRLFVNDENGQPRHIQMPIYSSDDPRAEWLMNDRATMPVNLIRSLQQAGFEVNRQRQWTPVGQSDEAPVLVPVEELKITPVSSRSYQ